VEEMAAQYFTEDCWASNDCSAEAARTQEASELDPRYPIRISFRSVGSEALRR